MIIFRKYFIDNVLKSSGRTLMRSHINNTKPLTTAEQHLNEWVSVIGLEIHAQINTKSKLFSESRNESDSKSQVNTNVNFFDAAIPGTLPVLNKASVEAAILTGLALSCDINIVSIFERKHYFYADLPLGYQITQRSLPIASNGSLELKSGKKIRLKQIQLEQDSGKSIHSSYDNCSYIDLNRAGIPLMELVFEPDLATAKETVELLKELILMLRYLRTCTCKMEEGALRVDANISINHYTEPYLSGIRAEVKNISSIKAVHDAIEYEIRRQIKMRLQNREIVNETRSWSSEKGCTLSMRDKETKQDYRFYPEFNLPPLIVQKAEIEDVREKMPLLPNDIRSDLKNKHGLKEVQIEILIKNPNLFMAYKKCLNDGRDSKRAANFFINEVLTVLYKNSESELTDHLILNIGNLIDLLQEQCINLHIAKQVLDEIVSNNSRKTPIEIIEENNWHIVKDADLLESLCQEVLDNEPDFVQIYRKGKKGVLKIFMEKVAVKTRQCADMRQVDEIMKRLLNSKN